MAHRLDSQAFKVVAAERRWSEAVAPVLRRFLGRPFPGGNDKRVLLVHQPMVLAWPQFYPFYFYARRFADRGLRFRTVPFPAIENPALVESADAIFFQGPYWDQSGQLKDALGEIRRLNPTAPISFFDWAAPTDIRFSEAVSPWASHYVKKSLLRDRNRYLQPGVNHTVLAEHYCNIFGLPHDVPDWGIPADIADRLMVSPAFETSPMMLDQFDRNADAPDGPRIIDLHARIATGGTPWYAAMRKQAQDAVKPIIARRTVAWQGRVSQAQFMTELRQSRLCFSPFGYGELCWRDFEAILAGSVLIKPDMAQVESFADIFRPGETYVPVRWDLSDLEDVIEHLLAHPAEQRAIAARAYEAVRHALLSDKLENMAARLVTAQPRGAA